MSGERKMDRRALYTQKAIKEAFLRVKRNKDYNAITVADICREAEISRGTFYAHFGNIAEILDALLDEALANMDHLRAYISAPDSGAGPQCARPFCRFVRDDQEFRCILFDDALGHIVIKKLFCFQINGCFAVSKQFSNLKDREWCPVQNVIDRFIKGGAGSFPAKET